MARGEVEFRPGLSAAWTGLLLFALGWGVVGFVLTTVLDEKGSVSGVVMIAIILGGFFAIGLAGLHRLIRAMNCRIWISPERIRARTLWGRQISAEWDQVRRIRWYGSSSDSGQTYHSFQIDAIGANINYDETYTGYSQIERLVREYSGAQLEEMPFLESMFLHKETVAVVLLSLAATVAMAFLLIDRFGLQ